MKLVGMISGGLVGSGWVVGGTLSPRESLAIVDGRKGAWRTGGGNKLLT